MKYGYPMQKANDAMSLLRRAARSSDPSEVAEIEETVERYLREAADAVARRRDAVPSTGRS